MFNRLLPVNLQQLTEEVNSLIQNFYSLDGTINQMLLRIIDVTDTNFVNTMLHRSLTYLNAEYLLLKSFIKRVLSTDFRNERRKRHVLIFIMALIDSFSFKLVSYSGLQNVFFETTPSNSLTMSRPQTLSEAQTQK